VLFGVVANDHPVGRFKKKVLAAPGVTNVAEMIIGVVFVPEVPIAPVDVAVASVIVAADADGAANSVRPAASTKVAVTIEINFLNMRDPLNVTS
jgi:hypothetical protein